MLPGAKKCIPWIEKTYKYSHGLIFHADKYLFLLNGAAYFIMRIELYTK